MAYILPDRLQEGIQKSLPILPNNGNPGGANNMPVSQEEEQYTPPDPYAWLRPSPNMEYVQRFLESYADKNEQLWQDTVNPQKQSKFNLVVRDGDFSYMPINDYNVPLGTNAPAYPIPNELNYIPQRVPILPGE